MPISGVHLALSASDFGSDPSAAHLRAAAERILPPEWPRPSGDVWLAGRVRASGALLDVVAFVAHAGQSGTLVVKTRDAVRAVCFEAGELVGAATTEPGERIGELLCQTGDVCRDDVDEASCEALVEGSLVGEVLVARGRVDEATLHRALRKQAEEIFFATLRVEDGVFCLFDDELVTRAPGRQRTTLSLMIEATRRLEEMNVLRATLESADAVPVRCSSAASRVPEEHRRVFQLCDGSRTIREIGRRLGLFEFDAMQAIYALATAELVELCPAPTRRTTAHAVDALNDVLREVHRICDLAHAGDELRVALSAYVVGTSDLAAMLRDIEPNPDGTLNPEMVLSRAAAGPLDELLERALKSYAAFAARQAGVLLPSRAMDRLLAWAAQVVGAPIESATPTLHVKAG